MGQVRSIDADGLLAAQSSTANSIGARPRATPDIDRWQDFITEASRRFAVPEFWIRVVMAAESAGQTMLDGRPITSPAGAMGLMQVIPETYAEMRLRHGLGADPYDPRDNILAGTAYLRAMYDRYGNLGFFAAYNVGPARFEGYLQRVVPCRKRRCTT
jgi:soluble lytic murein transglycosylase-like protein